MVVGMSPKMFISDMWSHGLLKSFHHFQSSTRLYTSETTQTIDLVFHCTCGFPLPYLLIGVELAALSQSFHLAGLEVLKIIVADGSGWLRPEMDILDNIVVLIIKLTMEWSERTIDKKWNVFVSFLSKTEASFYNFFLVGRSWKGNERWCRLVLNDFGYIHLEGSSHYVIKMK